MSKFLNALSNEMNMTTTTNGAVALKSTSDEVLDLFATCGAIRGKSNQEIEKKFSRAMATDLELATKLLFYTRDIRFVGVGERRTFRVALQYLANQYSEVIAKNIHNIPFYGRFDDLFVLFGTKVEDEMVSFVLKQLNEDILNMQNEKQVSLLGKWMPSNNTSSKETVAMANLFASKFGMNAKQYRKTLSALRKYIDVTEVKMSANQWSDIEYSKVPSYAMNRYRTAFYTHDIDRITSFIESVKKGETKINSSTLFPYDIISKVRRGENSEVLEAQWNALPDYISDEFNALVMADVSGSMNGRPLDTSIGLAMYFAERNKGAFHNKFMTFSAIPTLQDVKGRTLYEKVRNLNNAKWDMNTDLEKAMMVILKTAVDNNISQDELPKSLIIVSDMQFDGCVRGVGGTFYDEIKKRFASHGYVIPSVIFWNVNDTKDSFQVYNKCAGVQLVSGQSINTFKIVMNNCDKTPYDLMVETLNNECYDRVIV